MNLELGTLLVAGAKSIGEMLIKEIKNHMQNNKLTADTRAKIKEEKAEIVKQYGNEIYEVKNGAIYVYDSSSKFPNFVKSQDLKDGYYIMKNGSFEYDDNMSTSINTALSEMKEKLITEEKEFLNSQRVEGEEYQVDEIGDDDKYLFLTRKSNNVEFQEFQISEDLYNQLLNTPDISDLTVIRSGNGYKMK